jgi:small subunit ribosomal protein S21
LLGGTGHEKTFPLHGRPKGGSSLLTLVRVSSEESFEKALRRFKKTCEKSGVLADIRRHQHFEKPSERRKRKLNSAKRKVRRMARIQALKAGN